MVLAAQAVSESLRCAREFWRKYEDSDDGLLQFGFRGFRSQLTSCRWHDILIRFRSELRGVDLLTFRQPRRAVEKAIRDSKLAQAIVS